jgi:hypothetical protein
MEDVEARVADCCQGVQTNQRVEGEADPAVAYLHWVELCSFDNVSEVHAVSLVGLLDQNLLAHSLTLLT